MANKKNQKQQFGLPPIFTRHRPATPSPGVDSLLEVMKDGVEYQSILSAKLKPGREVLDDIVRSMEEITAHRGRPCIAYVGNVLSTRGDSETGINSNDDTPFHEMISQVPAGERRVDVLLATKGGSAHQVSRFVNFLRDRFDEVDFLIPSFCMSAGTLFALSGDRIWMTPRACLGPIDPQVPTKDGRYVPCQALILLVKKLNQDGMDALSSGNEIPWTAVRLVDTLDKKELGDAVTASEYSITMASEFLRSYKFRNWKVRRGSGTPVDDEYRKDRAEKIAAALASHDKWKNHGHSISRKTLWNEIELEIDHPDPALERLIYRFWALCSWMFDKTPALKVLVSPTYRYVRHFVVMEISQ